MPSGLPSRPLARHTVESQKDAAFVGSLPGPIAVDVVSRSDDAADAMATELGRHGRRLLELSESVLVTDRSDLMRLPALVSDDGAVCVDLSLVEGDLHGFEAAILELVAEQLWDLFCLAEHVYAVTRRPQGPGSAGDRVPRRPVAPLLSGAASLPLRSAQSR